MHIHTSDQASLNLGFGNYSCNWGTHICGLYETDAARDEILCSYLGQGWQDGDREAFCIHEASQEHYEQGVRQRVPDCGFHFGQGEQAQLYTPREIYYPEGGVSVPALDTTLTAIYDLFQKPGPRNVRAAAVMSWAREAIPGVEELMAYEARLNYFVSGRRWVSVCLYNLNVFSGATIMQVLQTHPYSISAGRILKNPYYQPPDEWLARHAPQYLNAA